MVCTLLIKGASTLFRVACVKEFLLPNNQIQQICGEENVSLEARTLYWLLTLAGPTINVRPNLNRLTDENQIFEFLKKEFKKYQLSPKQLEKLAKQLRWLFAPKNTPMEKVTLPSCEKPAYFFQFNPHATNAPCFLYCHGGGYYQGSYANGFATLTSICKQLNANLMCMTYDFLPDNSLEKIIEHTAKECYDFLVQSKNIQPKKIILIGESAGGNLVMNLAKRIGPNGCSCVITSSPWLDLTLSMSEEMLKITQDNILHEAFITIAKVLVARDEKSKHYSPLFWSTDELDQLPPLFISVSQCDKFTCVPHAYAIFGVTKEAKQTTEASINFIKTCLAQGQS